MDDLIKNAPSYQLDQDILDARGINMTVEEVAGLSTGKYSHRVQSLNLSENDLVFLKCLRRRIKNRVASQNSRRRSVEHLRRLARELRAVRACRRDALCERRALLDAGAELRGRCKLLRAHIVQVLKDRADPSPVPDVNIERIESQTKNKKCEPPPDTEAPVSKKKKENIFECRIEKLVQQSVNHIYKEKNEKKIVSAKTVFLDTKTLDVPNDIDIKIEYDSSLECPLDDCQNSGKNVFNPEKINGVIEPKLDIKVEYDTDSSDYHKLDFDKTKFVQPECYPLNVGGKSYEQNGVLNLCVKERRRSHGRKQLAPKRITYVFTDNDDGVIDFSIKKEHE